MRIADQHQDFPQWYQDVVQYAELAENGPVRGTMVIKPYGYAIWEAIQQELDRRIKATGVKNAYFPLLIPESFINREAEHVEGFSPELAVVTHAGGSKLAEPLVIRPTSETIINEAFAKWIKSYRDLPLLINQWANIVRWEMRPRLFLRTTEFLWQEGHTAHATKAEADAEALQMLEVYRKFIEEYLALPALTGRKSASERFAGADETYTLEGMMQDGKALQMGTSHNLGQNFAKVFDTKYLDKDNKLQYVWQSSWGVSTRLIGGLVMAHGDAKGLVLPPLVAPVQVVIIPIKEDQKVTKAVTNLKEELVANGVRVEIDNRQGITAGFKFNEWELKGVPLRIELGPKDLAAKHCILVRRDRSEKEQIALKGADRKIKELLTTIQNDLLIARKSELKKRTTAAKNYQEMATAISTGFAEVDWCGSDVDESKMKEELKATVRLITDQKTHGHCAVCGESAKYRVIIGRSY